MSLMQALKNHLNVQKEIPFVEYMQMALYAPNEGYYSSGLQKLGKHGDFTTAPEMTSLFGKTLANQFQQVLSTLTSPNILEFGAGSGALCVDVLQQLEHLQCLPDNYYILEVSSNLKHRQKEWINQRIPHLAYKVSWIDTWPEKPMNGVIVANEVLDAMPVHRFLHSHEGVLESYITLDETNELKEIFKPSTNPRLIQFIENNLSELTPPYLSEVNLFIDDWIANCSQTLDTGAMFILDYGFPRHEYYHPDRNQGTLMCHYQHQSHSNPLMHPGEEDITAHVDFTHVAEAALHSGFHVAGYTNQASFLLANGLLSFVNPIENQKELLHTNQAIKQLTQPSEMGELFKVIALSKNLEIDFHGFLLNDKRASL